MGKNWNPQTTVSWNRATTSLSNIVSMDESPLLEGLLYVGTDDGLVQMSEDGGRAWRRVEGSRARRLARTWRMSRRRRVTSIPSSSPRKLAARRLQAVSAQEHGLRTHVHVGAGNLPNRYPVWAVIQDHVNGSLLFAGTEFGLFFSPDGGQRWVQLRGGLPTGQVRDLDVQRRENDLVLGTFGRSFYVLDDYSALRGVTPEALRQEAALFPLRHAYQFPALEHHRGSDGNWSSPNPPDGAVLTYHVRETMPPGTSLAIRMSDPRGAWCGT